MRVYNTLQKNIQRVLRTIRAIKKYHKNMNLITPELCYFGYDFFHGACYDYAFVIIKRQP